MKPNDILFFYFLHLVRENFAYMRRIEKIVRQSKSNYFIDIFLIYLYMTLGAQVNVAVRYLHFYIHQESLAASPFRERSLPIGT